MTEESNDSNISSHKYTHNGRLFYNFDSLGTRLQRLPMSELLEVINILGISSDQVYKQKGNRSTWSLLAGIISEINDQNKGVELHRLLLDYEEKLGLLTPKFYPWPLTVVIDTTAFIELDGPGVITYLCTSDGLPGLCTSGNTRQEAMDQVRESVIILLKNGWGIDINAINEELSFDCLYIKDGEFSITTDNQDKFNQYIKYFSNSLTILKEDEISSDNADISSDCPVCHRPNRKPDCKACDNPETINEDVRSLPFSIYTGHEFDYFQC